MSKKLEGAGSVLGRILLIAALTVCALTMVVPVLWMVSTSLKSGEYVLTFPPRLVVENMSLSSYEQLFAVFPMARMFLNSVIVSVLATAGQIIVSAMAAFAFARITFRGKNAIFFLYIATLMIPFQVVITPLFILMRYIGWVNTYPGIIVPTMTMHIAFGVFLLRQYFASVPKEIEESAFMDGASYPVVFSRIVLPLVTPALATLGVLAFMNSWNGFLWPLFVIRDTEMMTLPVGLANLHGRYTTEWNLVMAGAVVSILPIVTVFVFAQKQFIEGIARTGIKG